MHELLVATNLYGINFFTLLEILNALTLLMSLSLSYRPIALNEPHSSDYSLPALDTLVLSV